MTPSVRRGEVLRRELVEMAERGEIAPAAVRYQSKEGVA